MRLLVVAIVAFTLSLSSESIASEALWEMYKDAGSKQLEQQHDKEAKQLFQAALEEIQTVPSYDIRYLLTATKLAECNKQLKNYPESERLYKQVLDILQKSPNRNEFALSDTMDEMAELYLAQGKYQQAEVLYKQALEIRQKQNSNSPETLESLEHLAQLFEIKGEQVKANALRERLKALTEKATETASTPVETLAPLTSPSTEQTTLQVSFSSHYVPNRNDSTAQSIPLPATETTNTPVSNLKPLTPVREQTGREPDDNIKPVSLTPMVHTTNSKSSISLSNEERKLYDLINRYRQQRGLSAIPVSNALSQIARLHVQDLATNQPMKGACGIFSWSNKGHWKPVCYVQGKTPSSVMWERPKELTGYPGYGYEIAHWSPDATANETFQGWVKNPRLAQMFTTQGQWSEKSWQAIGIGIQDGYVVVWFGEKPDSDATIADNTGIPKITPFIPNNEQENHIIPVSWSPLSASMAPEPILIPGSVTQRTINELSEHPPSIAGKEKYQSNWKSLRTFDLTQPLARPLRIYVESYPNETAVFKPSYIDLVKESLQEWADALNGRLVYELTTNKQKSDMDIHWVDKITEIPAASGITRSNAGHAKIKIIGKNGPDNQIGSVILHEIGHALGLLEHSRNPNDVMYPQKTWYKGTESYYEHSHLSNNDVAAIQRLYGASHKAGEDVYKVIPGSNTSKVAMQPVVKQGQPSTLNTTSPIKQAASNFNIFTEYLNQKIKAQWQPPASVPTATVRVLIKVDRQGNLIACDVTQSSGSQMADNAALSAVKSAAPFLGLPKSYGEEFILIDFSFN